MINLLCPYCGGEFRLDAGRDLQKQWICPYCGNKSRMDKQDGKVKLIGMVESGRRENIREDNEQLENQQPEETQPAKPEVPVAPVPGHTRPLAEMIAEAREPGIKPPPAVQEQESGRQPESENNDEESGSAQVRPVIIEPESKYRQLANKAEQAAENGNIALFNIYSRKALLIKPDDAQMYSLQAILREKANAFANGTWASPVWPFLTPRQKTQLLAQKLYYLNTALTYSSNDEKSILIDNFAAEITRQAIDHFTEQAEIRRSKMLFVRKFKGRFRKADLRTAKPWLNTLKLLDNTTCPLAHSEIKQTIAAILGEEYPRVAKKLRRKIRKKLES